MELYDSQNSSADGYKVKAKLDPRCLMPDTIELVSMQVSLRYTRISIGKNFIIDANFKAKNRSKTYINNDYPNIGNKITSFKA